jgi:hypothetical protein
MVARAATHLTFATKSGDIVTSSGPHEDQP